MAGGWRVGKPSRFCGFVRFHPMDSRGKTKPHVPEPAVNKPAGYDFAKISFVTFSLGEKVTTMELRLITIASTSSNGARSPTTT
jgi:hypothetical protein